jgi:hypothetical protein
MIEQIKDGGLLEALNGPQGSLDAWLGVRRESEVRAAILSAISPTETLRDKFAGKAMQAIWGAFQYSLDETKTPDCVQEIARDAYAQADAMLIAKEAKS